MKQEKIFLLIAVFVISIQYVVITVMVGFNGDDKTETLNNINMKETNNTLDSFDISHVIPYRTINDRIIAFEKFINGTGKLLFIHYRKAAGTSVGQWLKHLTEQCKRNHQQIYGTSSVWDSKIERIELYPRDLINITERLMTDKHTIYVLNYREPISRIISQYEFEWRFLCQTCTINNELKHDTGTMNVTGFGNYLRYYGSKNPKTTELSKNINFYDRYKYGNMALETMIDMVKMYELNDINGWRQTKYIRTIAKHNYLYNYYLWFNCCHHYSCSIWDFNDTKMEYCWYNSLKILKSFDIIMISEWLYDVRFQLYINFLFNNTVTLDTHNINHKNAWDFASNVPNNFIQSGTSRKTKTTHKGTKNLMLSPKYELMLKNWNKYDIKYYNIAKNISYTRAKTIWATFNEANDIKINEMKNKPSILYPNDWKQFMHDTFSV